MSIQVDIRKRLGSFDLEIAFEAGDETFGLLGASGCGKSMTLRCIAGVDTPDEGKIVIDGTTCFDSEAKIDLPPQKRDVGMLFQNYHLFANLTVRQNVEAGLHGAMSKRDRKAIGSRLLDQFELAACAEHYPATLSGGQQQRVGLARMLAPTPRILMLDEPFSALDPHLKANLESDLLGSFARFKGSILYISHDIDEVYRFCDRAAVIDSGRIVETNDIKELVSSPQTLAGIKITGCKNISAASKVADRGVAVHDWGVTLEMDAEVPEDVAYAGIRATYLQRAAGPAQNVFRCRIEQELDSRFENAYRIQILNERGAVVSRIPLQWNVSKQSGEQGFPAMGDIVYLSFSPNDLYLVNS